MHIEYPTDAFYWNIYSHLMGYQTLTSIRIQWTPVRINSLYNEHNQKHKMLFIRMILRQIEKITFHQTHKCVRLQNKPELKHNVIIIKVLPKVVYLINLDNDMFNICLEQNPSNKVGLCPQSRITFDWCRHTLFHFESCSSQFDVIQNFYLY